VETATSKPWSADELARLPTGFRYEIDEGDLVIMSPAGRRHGLVTARVTALIVLHVRAHRLGDVVSGEVGIRLGRGGRETLRAADVAFYAGPARIADERGFLPAPPDLAVEVHDPSEPDLRRKIDQYLAAGVRAVWTIDPDAGTLTRHAPAETPRTWSNPDDIVEEPLLPGFSCRLRELLAQD
jgi:Uma2 family endonuclease